MATVFAVACVAFGVACAGSAVLGFREERRRRRWPTVRGRLLTRSVELDANGWRPRVRYEYVILGEHHVGQEARSRAASRFVAYNSARAFIHALDAEPEVHYDPARPGVSFLAPTSLVGGALLFGFGVLLGAFGAAVLLR